MPDGRESTATDPHGGPDPAYQRIRQYLSDQIAAGTIAPGSRLSAERTLAEQLGVSRVTLRRSLQQLVADGLVTPSRGRGWFVTPDPLSEPPNVLLSFTDMATSAGKTARAELLARVVEPATPDQAAALGLRPGAATIVLERLRLIDDFPMAVIRSRLPLARFRALAKADLTDVSLYRLLRERYGVIPTESDFQVEARPAETRIADLLGIEAAGPVLTVRQQTRDQHGTPVELADTHYRADRYRFRATVRSNDAGSGPIAMSD
ncbi:MAG TPA: GntR family transcriptional regulator [Mycobacteriales bacterium]|nr:GntR family transcriptional regulator [Mycobacteriales bacterium]